jgi:hypothetical protein
MPPSGDRSAPRYQRRLYETKAFINLRCIVPYVNKLKEDLKAGDAKTLSAARR